ncbi:MAG: hypothetical protein COC20_02995 [Cellvibrionales bacterium]|nr:MAG: hypothetical protein COC20_02995 [Cellvibrionales bacterium]
MKINNLFKKRIAKFILCAWVGVFIVFGVQAVQAGEIFRLNPVKVVIFPSPVKSLAIRNEIDISGFNVGQGVYKNDTKIAHKNSFGELVNHHKISWGFNDRGAFIQKRF